MNEAKTLLTHYFRTVWERSGLTWNSDNAVEVESIIDLIIEEAKREAKPHEHRFIPCDDLPATCVCGKQQI